MSKANTIRRTTKASTDEQDNNQATNSDNSPHLAAFRSWCEGKKERRSYEGEGDRCVYQHPVEHAYSYKSELQKFVRTKDVGRHFVQEYDKFTTVLITYTQDRCEGETVVEHANSFYPRTIVRDRRKCLKTTGHYHEYVGVSLLAPKDIAPSPTAQTTHAHDMIWLPGFVSSEHFDRLRQREGVDVSMRYHRSDKVETPPSVNRADLDRERGPTSALPHEVGANLPVLAAVESFRDTMKAEASTNSARLKATLDARDCPAYVERWCAHMRVGTNDIDELGTDDDSGGIRRWRPLGQFTEIADNMKEKRGYGSEGVGSIGSDEKQADTLPDKWADTLTSTEQEFVGEYVAADLPTDRSTIKTNLDRNQDEFGRAGVNTEQVIKAVQSVG